MLIPASVVVAAPLARASLPVPRAMVWVRPPLARVSGPSLACPVNRPLPLMLAAVALSRRPTATVSRVGLAVGALTGAVLLGLVKLGPEVAASSTKSWTPVGPAELARMLLTRLSVAVVGWGVPVIPGAGTKLP